MIRFSSVIHTSETLLVHEPSHEKTNNLGFQLGQLAQTSQYNYRSRPQARRGIVLSL